MGATKPPVASRLGAPSTACLLFLAVELPADEAAGRLAAADGVALSLAVEEGVALGLAALTPPVCVSSAV